MSIQINPRTVFCVDFMREVCYLDTEKMSTIAFTIDLRDGRFIDTGFGVTAFSTKISQKYRLGKNIGISVLGLWQISHNFPQYPPLNILK
jgi:hypothetical protein